MNERIKSHVEEIFCGVPHTRQAADVKEELMANLQAKYDDLTENGKSEDEAFRIAVSGIGDIRSLLGEQPQFNVEETQAGRQKSGIIKTIGIMILIFSVIPTLTIAAIFGDTWLDWLVPVTFMTFAVFGVGMIILGASLSPKKYKKSDETFVEEYKEKTSGNSRDHRLYGSVRSTLWLTVVLLYFLISFTTHAWHITWLIFIIGAIVQNIVGYLMGSPGSLRKLTNSTVWLITLVVYFWISFTTGAWAWTWLIFIISLLISQIIKLLSIWREES